MTLIRKNLFIIFSMILISCSSNMYTYKPSESTYKPQTTLLAEQHIATINERDPVRRSEIFKSLYNEDFTFADPESELSALEDLSRQYDMLHQKHPHSVFSINGPVQVRQNIVRIKWKLGRPGMPAHTTGEDIIFLKNDKIKSLFVFVDSQKAIRRFPQYSVKPF